MSIYGVGLGCLLTFSAVLVFLTNSNAPLPVYAAFSSGLLASAMLVWAAHALSRDLTSST